MQNELEQLKAAYAQLEFRFSVLERQYKIIVDSVADAKTAILIATNAQTMASEAMIQASTGKSLSELTGQPDTSGLEDGFEGFGEKPSSGVGENVVSMSKRNEFYENLAKSK